MDNALKGLVAAACLIIIVGGSYFAWSHYIEWKSAKDDAFQRAEAEKIEHCKAYKTNGKLYDDESAALVKLKLQICHKDYPELF